MSDELYDNTPDLPAEGPALDVYGYEYSASSSDLKATSSELVSLDTIHNDIQLLNFSFLAVFCILFVYVLIVRRFK